MRKSRFSEEQMVAILREADSSSVASAAKRHKLSEQTKPGHGRLQAQLRCGVNGLAQQGAEYVLSSTDFTSLAKTVGPPAVA